MLSKGTSVVRWGVEEHVMCAYAEEWRESSRLWSALYDGQNGPSEIIFAGELPSSFAEVVNSLYEEQSRGAESDAEVDYVFDGVEIIVRSIVGYHDEAFEEVGWTNACRESLWRRFFPSSLTRR